MYIHTPRFDHNFLAFMIRLLNSNVSSELTHPQLVPSHQSKQHYQKVRLQAFLVPITVNAMEPVDVFQAVATCAPPQQIPLRGKHPVPKQCIVCYKPRITKSGNLYLHQGSSS